MQVINTAELNFDIAKECGHQTNRIKIYPDVHIILSLNNDL
jgi:hypothetical protein